MVANVCKTNININGNNVYSSTYTLGGCCCNNGFINSCFFNPSTMLGATLGMTAAAITIPMLPSFFNWMGTKALPAVWNGFLKPVGSAIGSAAVWVANGIADGAKWVFQKTGMKKLWQKIFPPKNKSKSEKT